jgi:hypothetical protein
VDAFELQPVELPTCQAFNEFLVDTGWKDFDGNRRKGWAGGTKFDVVWVPEYRWTSRRVDGGIELTTARVKPKFGARKRLSRLDWVGPSPRPAACQQAVDAWIAKLALHERDHGADIDRVFEQANRKPVLGPFTARAATLAEAKRALRNRIDAVLTELAGPMKAQIAADEQKYHEEHTVPLVECGAC